MYTLEAENTKSRHLKAVQPIPGAPSPEAHHSLDRQQPGALAWHRRQRLGAPTRGAGDPQLRHG